MKNKPMLTADDARRIATAAEAEALAHQWAVSIAIVDDGGHLLWLQRLDGAPPISAQIAPAKAHTAAVGRRESKVYEDMINGGPRLVPQRAGAARHARRRRAHRGGRPVVGAVGVSGVKSSEDAQIARAGIAALAA
jgi:glc operon protein GlcG